MRSFPNPKSVTLRVRSLRRVLPVTRKLRMPPGARRSQSRVTTVTGRIGARARRHRVTPSTWAATETAEGFTLLIARWRKPKGQKLTVMRMKKKRGRRK